MNQYWSWALGLFGVLGFVLAGRKIWWAWYVNIACQALWFTYSIVTQQWGFFVSAAVYTFVFTQNAYKWTKEHRQEQRIDNTLRQGIDVERLLVETACFRFHGHEPCQPGVNHPAKGGTE